MFLLFYSLEHTSNLELFALQFIDQKLIHFLSSKRSIYLKKFNGVNGSLYFLLQQWEKLWAINSTF